MTETSSARLCPACGTEAAGRFCSSCGSALDPSVCAACRSSLAPGSSFCHRCGAPVGHHVALGGPAEPRGLATTLPWIVAGIALLALIGLVAGQRLTTARSANVAAAGSSGAFAAGSSPGTRPPDISQLSPREVASRLYDRVMRLHAEGKSDSVAFFAANMAIPAFQMLDSLDADARYDLGRIAEVAGAYPLARAQADSILADDAEHLLGLVLAARVAGATGETAAQRAYRQRLLAAQEHELARGLPEYEAHRSDIQMAVSEARRGG